MGVIWLSFFFYLGMRYLPYLSSQVPLGYDAGLYLYLFKQYHAVPYQDWLKMPEWVVAMFPPVVPLIGKILTTWIPPEQLVIPFVLVLSALLFWAVVAGARRWWGVGAAKWSAILLAISAIQFRAYWYYYAKQIGASAILLLILPLLSRANWWALPLSILLVLTHRPTAILLAGALVYGWIRDKKRRNYYGVIGVVTAVVAGGYYLATREITILPLWGMVEQSVVPLSWGGTLGAESGTFYNRLPALILALPYLPWAVWGIIKRVRKQQLTPLMGVTISTLVIVGLGLFLWRRFLIYLDLWVILWAASGIQIARERWGKLKWWKWVMGSYLLFLVLFGGAFVWMTGKPPIAKDELAEIAKLRETEPSAYVLVTDQTYMPWIYGYSERKPIAPGYGQYDVYWTPAEWHTFWESDNRETERAQLVKLPKPLYIYQGNQGKLIKPQFDGECFERINWRTYKFVCEERR